MNIVLSSDVLSMPEAFLDAFTVILVVFGVLFIMFVLISLSGKIFASAASVKKEEPKAEPAAPEEEFSSGTLKLKGCDEKTAAMIMAIVSDNTGIPLSELVFKSITLVEEK